MDNLKKLSGQIRSELTYAENYYEQKTNLLKQREPSSSRTNSVTKFSYPSEFVHKRKPGSLDHSEKPLSELQQRNKLLLH
jgi:hypothetical protein